MFSPRQSSLGSAPPELSNNPFIDHPSNALTRFPDINGTDAPVGTSQFTSWLNRGSSSISPSSTGFPGAQPSGFTGAFAQQQQLPQQTGYPASPVGAFPQQTGFNGAYSASPIQAQPTGRPFQPSSSFGQQLASQINGAYAAPAVPQQPQQQQYSGYPTSPQYATTPQYGAAYGYPQQQPQQQQTQYLAEFDPYAPQQQQQQQQQVPAPAQTQQSAPLQSGYQAPHPRDYVRTNKRELESWDPYAWKQVMNCFDALKDAWANRKKEIEARMNVLSSQGLFGGGGGYGGYGYNQYGQYGQQQFGQAQEYSRLEQLAKQADSNVDTAVAAKFQMEEAHTGYRQSGDLASKKRVREAINAALSNLPDWPPQSF